MSARIFTPRAVASVLVALAAAGCGGAVVPPEAVGPDLTIADPAVAATLSGRVLFEGPPPAPVPLSMDSDPGCRGKEGGAVAQDIVVDSDGGLRNVVVWIQEGLPSGRYAPPSGAVTLDQNGCMYQPRVVALMIGQELQITNSDATTHNVHPAPKQNREWNRSQFAGAIPIQETFDREEVAVPIRCNVHPWMKAWVAVLRHPFFGVTSAGGSFRIEGVPPGEYTVAAWHEKLGTARQHVTLAERGAASLDFTFRPAGGA